MTCSFFFAADVMTHLFAVGHHKGDPPAVARPWPITRCSHPAGGISSTVTDLVRYARFHLGDGTAESGERLLKPETIRFMQSQRAPAGNWADFVGITWMLRDIYGIRLVGHGGSTNGFNASFELVPQHDFAIVILTNADNGSVFYREVTDWALEHFLDIKKQKLSLLKLSDDELTTYAGSYQATLWNVELALHDHQLWLHMEYRGGFPTRDTPPPEEPPTPPMRLGFYDRDRVVILDPPMEDSRAEFLRSPDGTIAWFRFSGRIHRPL
jgi:CubicO group peptidase (beta-lactamase class C family)